MMSPLFLLALSFPVFSSAFSVAVRRSGTTDEFVDHDLFVYHAGKSLDVQLTVDTDGFLSDTSCAWNCAKIYFFIKEDGWNLLDAKIPVGEKHRGAWFVHHEDGTVDRRVFCGINGEPDENNLVTKVIFEDVPLPEHTCYETTLDVNGAVIASKCASDFGISITAQDSGEQQQNVQYCMRETWGGHVIANPNFSPVASPPSSFRGTDAEPTTSGSLSPGAIAGLIAGFLVTICACFAAGSACTLVYTRRQRKVTQAAAVRSSSRGGTHRGGVSRSTSGNMRR
jgi:hypothetical protein